MYYPTTYQLKIFTAKFCEVPTKIFSRIFRMSLKNVSSHQTHQVFDKFYCCFVYIKYRPWVQIIFFKNDLFGKNIGRLFFYPVLLYPIFHIFLCCQSVGENMLFPTFPPTDRQQRKYEKLGTTNFAEYQNTHFGIIFSLYDHFPTRSSKFMLKIRVFFG